MKKFPMVTKLLQRFKEWEDSECDPFTIALRVMLVFTVIVFIMSLVACNKQVVDLTYSYERAIISLPNGEIVDGKVQSWTDYANSDQIQVKIDGVTYLLHASQVVLISE